MQVSLSLSLHYVCFFGHKEGFIHPALVDFVLSLTHTSKGSVHFVQRLRLGLQHPRRCLAERHIQLRRRVPRRVPRRRRGGQAVAEQLRVQQAAEVPHKFQQRSGESCGASSQPVTGRKREEKPNPAPPGRKIERFVDSWRTIHTWYTVRFF